MWMFSRGDIDVAEKVLAHERVVRLRMLVRQPTYSSRLKVRTPREIEAVLAVHPHEFAIHRERRAARGEAEHGVRFASARVAR